MEQYVLEAACACQTGRLRTNNEDNFYFDGRCLQADNKGLRHPVSMTARMQREICLAVFDGIGGEDFGEAAAFTAAQGMRLSLNTLNDYVVPERPFLKEMCARLNELVRARGRELQTERMGTTMTALFFSQNYVYVCNLGDSRAYRLRSGEFLQLSRDHTDRTEGENKGLLTHFLGMNTDERALEPYIAKGEIRPGDWYLICTDGLTDALSNLEIDFTILHAADPKDCVQTLVQKAAESGGKDNVTVIAIRIARAPGASAEAASE